VPAEGEGFRVEVDLEACEATGFCAQVVPEVFEISDEGVLHLLRDTAGDALEDCLREAEALCPTQAIRIIPSDG
jgi:ferredoxin